MSTDSQPQRRRRGGQSNRPRGNRGVAPGGKSKNFSGSLKRLIKSLRPDAFILFITLLASATSVVLSVIAPKILGRGTDIIFNGVIGKMMADAPSKEAAIEAMRASGHDRFADMLSAMDVVPGQGIDMSQLGKVLLTVCAIYAASALVGLVGEILLRIAVQNAGWRMRDEIQRKIERLPLSYLDQHSRGDLISRVSNDVDNVTQVMNQTLSQFFQSVLTVVGIVAMMVSMSWKLTLLAMVIIPFGAAIAVYLMKKAQPQFVEQWNATGEVSGVVEEAMTGHEVVALYGLEERFTDEFNDANTRLYHSSFKAQFISNLMMPLMGLLSNGSYVVVAVGGGLMVANGGMTLGQVQAFIQYSRQFSQPLGQLASMANSLQSGIASAERIFEFLDAPEMEPDNGASSFALAHVEATDETPEAASSQTSWDGQASTAENEHVRGHIVFDHVRFGYSPDKPVIKDLSVEVQPGQTVAIIGPTGAGKTTLVNLLMRFYELDSGAIRIDGVDISTINKDVLRSHMGMVLQDTWLFEGTIEKNIAFGREGSTPEDVRQAAKETAAHRLITQLPNGYDTKVADQDDQISAGERQLLTIARAFIAHPDLMILDEATSSVDTRTEALVQKAMDQISQDRTSFVIAHRLSTIRDADLILVMEDGDVVETGRHAELLERGGAYARLYQAQFAGPAVTDEDDIA